MNISTQDELYLDSVRKWAKWLKKKKNRTEQCEVQYVTNTKEEDEVQWTELGNVFKEPQPGI